MRLDRIYTKVGDGGRTHLASGQKVSKASLRLEAYGTVDELNGQMGLLVDFVREAAVAKTELTRLLEPLRLVQQELFDVGAELATPAEALDLSKQCVVDAAAIGRLEAEMDRANAVLPPLKNFILPGGHRVNSQAHIARCVCRRAERAIVRLGESETLRPELRIYTNRLSDWLFVLARTASVLLGCPEVLWQQRQPATPPSPTP